MIISDAQLLQRYARERDEEAFTEIVSRYGGMIYSAALRQTGGNVHLAKDILQIVFADLARKAGSISDNVVLAGWLHRATVLSAAQVKRKEGRRQMREELAMKEETIDTSDPGHWTQIEPVVDQLLAKLNPRDRDVLLLRFFQERSLKEIGELMGCGESGASQRISRALEKLRHALAQKGITCTSSALSSSLTVHAVPNVPLGLLGAVATASLAQAEAGSLFSVGLLKALTMTKLEYCVVSTLIVVGVGTPIFLQHQSMLKLQEENAVIQGQVASAAHLQTEMLSLSNMVSQLKRADALQKSDYLDLMRLRGEVGTLRTQLAAAQSSRVNTNAANVVSPELPANAVSAASLAPGVFPAAKWEDVGFGAPLNSAVTWLWAVRNGYAEEYSKSLGKTNILPFPIEWANALLAVDSSEITEAGVSDDGNPIIALGHSLKDGSSEKSWLTFRQDGGKWLVKSLTGYPIAVVATPISSDQ